MDKINVLINAYAVSPAWGSEPGMGWNWVSNLARYCNLYVITEGEWRKEIEEALRTHPHKENLHFFDNSHLHNIFHNLIYIFYGFELLYQSNSRMNLYICHNDIFV